MGQGHKGKHIEELHVKTDLGLKIPTVEKALEPYGDIINNIFLFSLYQTARFYNSVLIM